jgi:iron complex outermembrane recepter protein
MEHVPSNKRSVHPWLRLAVLATIPISIAAVKPEGGLATEPEAIPAAAAGDMFSMDLEDLVNMEVTSVSKKKQRIAEAPAAVYVITQDDIARSGMSTIPELFRLAPGMSVAQLNSSSWAISSRGMNGEFANKLLVLQDGRSVYTPAFSGVYWDSVDYILSDLDRIEIIRGPGATLWGANAVNGVINITSKSARDTQGWLLQGRGSNWDSNGAVRYGGKIGDDTYYRVYTKYRYNDEFHTAGDDGAGDQWQSLLGGFRLDKHPSDNDQITVILNGYGNNANVNYNAPVFTPPFTTRIDETRTHLQGDALVRWNHAFSEESDFSVQAYYDGFRRQDDFFNDHTEHEADLSFQHRFMLGKRNEITWGGGYRMIADKLRTTEVSSFDPDSRTTNLFSLYVQDAITLVPEKWTLTLGSKLEHNDYTAFEIQPSARLLWTPDRKQSVWTAVSRAVRTPSRFEHDASLTAARMLMPPMNAPAEFRIVGDENYDSEELVAYELGYRVQPHDSVSFDVALFFNDYDRLRSLTAQPPVIGPVSVVAGVPDNQAEGHSYGGELASTWRVRDNWRLVGSYSFIQGQFEGPAGARAPEYVDSAAEHQFQLRSYYNLTKSLSFNAALFFVDAVEQNSTPSYARFDLNVAYQPTEQLELTVGVANLFDDRHPESGGEGSNVLSEVPRTVFAQLNYRF